MKNTLTKNKRTKNTGSVLGLLLMLSLAAGVSGPGCGKGPTSASTDHSTPPADQAEVKSGGDQVGFEQKGYNGPLQAEVFSKGNDVFDKAGEVETSIANARLDQIWFRFPAPEGGEILEMEVPAEAMEALNIYFRHSLAYGFKKIETAQQANDADTIKMNESTAVGRKLVEIMVEAPDGRRNISWKERSRLIGFVSIRAAAIADELNPKK